MPGTYYHPQAVSAMFKLHASLASARTPTVLQALYSVPLYPSPGVELSVESF